MADNTFAGIDVASDKPDSCVLPGNDMFSGGYNAEGVASLVACMKKAKPALIVVEAPDGLEIPLVTELAVAGWPLLSSIPDKSLTLHGLLENSPRPVPSMPMCRLGSLRT